MHVMVATEMGMSDPEKRVTDHLKRWLWLLNSLTSTALYGHHKKVQLPLKSLEDEFKVTKAIEVEQWGLKWSKGD